MPITTGAGQTTLSSTSTESTSNGGNTGSSSSAMGGANNTSSTGSSTSGSTSSGGGAGGSGSTTTTTTVSTVTSASAGGFGGMPNTGGAGPSCPTGGPVLTTAGSTTLYVLRGTVLTPTGPVDEEVRIKGNMIDCVGVDCSSQPAASGATIVTTNGIISPGLIDTHNHILFDIFDEDDWSPPKAYGDHNQWPNDAKYGDMVDAKQWLNGETSGSPADLGCELDKYGEMKGLIAGTTSIVGSAGATNKICYGSVARTLDQKYNGLPADLMQTATIFPNAATASGVCDNYTNGKTTSYVIHVGEGVDGVVEKEFTKLGTITTVAPAMPDCLYDPRTTVVHGTDLTAADLTTMGSKQMNLTWSPASNVFLYGTFGNATPDLTKTTDIKTARDAGVNVSIGPDWSIGGSQNMLDELRFAQKVVAKRWPGYLNSQQLWEMATKNPAAATRLTSYIGSIEVGKRADIAVFFGDRSHPFDAVVAATSGEVTMVFVDGRLLYGNAELVSVGPTDAICESLDACCAKFACIANKAGTPTDKLGQTVAEIKHILEEASIEYDALPKADGDTYKFAPITPLVKCQ